MSVLARIGAALGFYKAAKLPAANRGRVVPDVALWADAGRIGGGLTPRKVSQILRQADIGFPMELMDLANECRQKDCHLQAVLSVSEESLAGLPWQLVIPENARAKDKRAAKWVESVLRSTTDLRKLVAGLSGAPYYSYDVNEIVWRKDGGDLIPDSFVHIAHRRFGFRLHDGRLIQRDISTGFSEVDFREQWPNKFVVSQPRINGDAAHREGLARVLVWATLFRTWTIADWLKTAELSWKPWRIGTYKKGAGDTEDREGLEEVLDRLTTTGWAAKSDAVDIDIEWPQGSVSTKATHSELVNVLAQEMSKAVLGQTETVQASTSSGYAQAKVHDAVRKDLREARANQIAADITRDLIAPMIALNFGDVLCPRFEFVTDDAADLASFSLALWNMTRAGLTVPQKWAREAAGIPEPKDNEAVLGPAIVDPNAPVTPDTPAAPAGDNTPPKAAA
jgi:phage gp29-like protein